MLKDVKACAMIRAQAFFADADPGPANLSFRRELTGPTSGSCSVSRRMGFILSFQALILEKTIFF